MQRRNGVEGTPSGASIAGRVAVVTGAGGGIGRELVAELARQDMAGIVAMDLHEGALAALQDEVDVGETRLITLTGDVTDPADVEAMVREAEGRLGAVDLVCSNAGYMVEGGPEVPVDEWQRSWEVNVLAHVHAVRATLPAMLERGRGAYLNTLSAAGCLTAPNSAPYTATKHAALGFAEWLAITYGNQGVSVCAVCPEAVDTSMLHASLANQSGGIRAVADAGGIVSPREVAQAGVGALISGQFLAATHPRTISNVKRKWDDVDRWIGGMASLLDTRDE